MKIPFAKKDPDHKNTKIGNKLDKIFFGEISILPSRITDSFVFHTNDALSGIHREFLIF